MMTDEEKIIWIKMHEKRIRNSFTKNKEKGPITIYHSSQCDSAIDIVDDYGTVIQEYEWFLKNNYVKKIDGKYIVLIF